MTTTCDGTRVGVLIYDEDNRLLMATGPTGLAPATRHAHTQRPVFLDAALAACQEIGLPLAPEDLKPVYSLDHPDRCEAAVGLPEPGEDAALPLARAVLAAMGLDDYEVVTKGTRA